MKLGTKKRQSVGDKSGDNAGKDAKKYSVRLPNKWVSGMKVTPEDRVVVISFDGSAVTIQKTKVESSEETFVDGKKVWKQP